MARLKYSALAVAATLFGGSLLALQIVGGLEYTIGGSDHTRASMVAAMVTVALLPVFIHAAWHMSKSISVVLFVAFAAFLAYSLPANVGRIGEIRETKASAASLSEEQKERLKSDYTKTSDLVEEANRWQARACKNGVGKDCRAATFVLNQRTASLEKLKEQIDGFRSEVGDLGSDTIAWALAAVGIDSSAVRKGSGLAFAGGLEFAIWALFWLASLSVGRAIAAKPVAEPVPAAAALAEPEPLKLIEHQPSDVEMALRALGGRVESSDTVVEYMQDVWKRGSKADVSRKLKELATAGKVRQTRDPTDARKVITELVDTVQD